jgi:plastocyanin
VLKMSAHRIPRRDVAARAVEAPTGARSPAATGSVKTKMTLTERILGNKTSESAVKPGDNVWVNVDKLLTHDVCGPGTFGVFENEFGANAKVPLAPYTKSLLPSKLAFAQNILVVRALWRCMHVCFRCMHVWPCTRQGARV